MLKQVKKATNLKVTGTKLIRRRIRDAERASQGRKQATTNSRREQLGKNDGYKLDRKQCKLLSGPYDQY